MFYKHTHAFVLLSLILTAVFSAQAAFVSYSGPGTVDTSVFGTLVDLNNPVQDPPFGVALNATPIEVYNSGGQTVNVSVPNFGTASAMVNFGTTFDFSNLSQTLSQYILNQTVISDVGLGTAPEILFSAGTAVSAIGIHISAITSASFPPDTLSAISLEIIFSDNTTAQTSITALPQATNDPTQAAFHGYSSASNNIIGFRITGGPIMLDNLRFGSLSGAGDPGDPGSGGGDPIDPAAVPEASTFLLCSGALGLLAMINRRRTARH